jgi:signal transduction histidine kinase
MSAAGTLSEAVHGRGVGERIAGLLRRAGLDLAYLSIGGLTAIVAFVVWVTALSVTLSLVVFIVGLPCFLLSAIAFRWTAELDRRNAQLVRGEPLRARYRDHDGESFLTRLGSTAADLQTWKDLAWLVVHSVLGFGFAVVAVSLVASVIGAFLMPLWFWSIPDGVDWGLWNIDSLPTALISTAISIPLALLSVFVIRGMAIAECWLAVWLLDGGEGAPQSVPLPGRETADRLRDNLPESEVSLATHVALTGIVAFAVIAIWGATGGGYFWPAWVLLGLLILLGLHGGIREARRVGPTNRALAIQGVVSAIVAGTAIAVWALAGFGNFWPFWTLLALAVAFALHFLWRRVFPAKRERELSERVETLTKTRRGALDVQSAELRRIERDLHDGAQARLVALSMQLGRAEQALSDNPEAVERLRAARSEASAAIAELRDLARGIAPPILSDRGLEAAVDALARRSPMEVKVEADLAVRPPVVIETAAYFVVAEALTNVAKHAPEASATVRIGGNAAAVRVEVADDGPGGANPAGSGLTGLRARVEALDGELWVSSPRDGGTMIEARLPCG